jgi:hypothetical protein
MAFSNSLIRLLRCLAISVRFITILNPFSGNRLQAGRLPRRRLLQKHGFGQGGTFGLAFSGGLHMTRVLALQHDNYGSLPAYCATYADRRGTTVELT